MRKKRNTAINRFLTKYIKPVTKIMLPIFNYVAKAISYAVFVVLIISACFLVYFYVSTKTYAENGAGYEPILTLYKIATGSMVPEINVDDVVVVMNEDDPQKIEIGDVISYMSSEFISGYNISVTHEVVGITVDKDGNYYYTTKGVANAAADPNPVSFDQVTGIVVMKIPQLGVLQDFLASKIGWLLIIVLPALFIIVKYIIQLLNLPGLLMRLDKNKKFLPLYTKQIRLPYTSRRFRENLNESDIIDLTKISSSKKEEIVKKKLADYFVDLTNLRK